MFLLIAEQNAFVVQFIYEFSYTGKYIQIRRPLINSFNKDICIIHLRLRRQKLKFLWDQFFIVICEGTTTTYTYKIYFDRFN